jgi:hypothetical protein
MPASQTFQVIVTTFECTDDHLSTGFWNLEAESINIPTATIPFTLQNASNKTSHWKPLDNFH